MIQQSNPHLHMHSFVVTVQLNTAIISFLTLPYLTSGVGRLLHLPSAEAVSVRPNAHPRM